jgi:hypothetical protein
MENVNTVESEDDDLKDEINQASTFNPTMSGARLEKIKAYAASIGKDPWKICWNCGEEGHSSRTCNKSIIQALQHSLRGMRKRERRRERACETKQKRNQQVDDHA